MILEFTDLPNSSKPTRKPVSILSLLLRKDRVVKEGDFLTEGYATQRW